MIKEKEASSLFHNFSVKQDFVHGRKVKEIVISKIEQKRCNTSLCQR
jgi:hypothetical protein